MKKIIFLTTLILFAGGSSAEENPCLYEIKENSIKAIWTAFKTTDKIPVQGEFLNIKLSGSKEANSLEDLLLNLNASIDLDSLSTKNEGRDKTLKEIFFSKLLNGISGRITKINPSIKEAVIELSLNGVSREVNLNYEELNGVFTAKGKIDLIDFSANSQLSDLNKACLLLHQGPDGISKTWSEVEFKIEATIEKLCNM